MVTKHLTDDEVQQYALDRSKAEKRIAEHIHICEECRSKAEVYQLMITAIEQQPRSAFDFNLSAAILNQLPMQNPRAVTDKWLTCVFIVISAGLIGTAFYFFRDYLDSMFKGVGTISIYLVAISAVTVIAWMLVEMYKRYQKDIRILDLY